MQHNRYELKESFIRHEGLLEEQIQMARENLEQAIYDEENEIINDEYSAADFREVLEELEEIEEELNGR